MVFVMVSVMESKVGFVLFRSPELPVQQLCYGYGYGYGDHNRDCNGDRNGDHNHNGPLNYSSAKKA